MSIFTRTALVALALFSAANAYAQVSAARTIRIGDSVRGNLDSKELEKERDWVVDYYDIRGQRGETITIELKSDDFDAYIDFDKGSSHVTEDDDGGSGLDSKLVYEFGDNDTYRINVTSSERDETGAYTLSVVRGGTPTVTATTTTPRAARETPNPRELRYGETIQSRITALSPLHRDDTPYIPFVFRGRRGETVTIDMVFDALRPLSGDPAARGGPSDLAQGKRRAARAPTPGRTYHLPRGRPNTRIPRQPRFLQKGPGGPPFPLFPWGRAAETGPARPRKRPPPH